MWEYLEFIHRPDETPKFFIEASPSLIEQAITSLENRLLELGAKPDTRRWQHDPNSRYVLSDVSRVDILNALNKDKWEHVSTDEINKNKGMLAYEERWLFKRKTRQDSKREFSLYDVAELVSVKREEVANGYIKKGWILINVTQEQHSEHSFSANYSLAWSGQQGEPVYPEIKSDSDYLNKIFDDVAKAKKS
jgi:hypothetical protein